MLNGRRAGGRTGASGSSPAGQVGGFARAGHIPLAGSVTATRARSWWGAFPGRPGHRGGRSPPGGGGRRRSRRRRAPPPTSRQGAPTHLLVLGAVLRGRRARGGAAEHGGTPPGRPGGPGTRARRGAAGPRDPGGEPERGARPDARRRHRRAGDTPSGLRFCEKSIWQGNMAARAGARRGAWGPAGAQAVSQRLEDLYYPGSSAFCPPFVPPRRAELAPAPWGEVGTWRSSTHRAHAWRLLLLDPNVASSSWGGWLWGGDTPQYDKLGVGREHPCPTPRTTPRGHTLPLSLPGRNHPDSQGRALFTAAPEALPARGAMRGLRSGGKAGSPGPLDVGP